MLEYDILDVLIYLSKSDNINVSTFMVKHLLLFAKFRGGGAKRLFALASSFSKAGSGSAPACYIYLYMKEC